MTTIDDIINTGVDFVDDDSGAPDGDTIVVGGFGKDTIVTQDGLVGKVSRVSSRTSRVTLLTDDASAASALDVETQAFGIVRSGDGARAPLRLDRVPKEARVAIDDTIVTSGWSSPRLSSLYPRGIRIGRVTSVGRTDTDLYTQVQVTPFADLSSLEAVLVLIPVDRKDLAR